MEYFLKLNVIGMLYALLIFIPAELMLNVYRISRLTKWEISTVNVLTAALVIAAGIGGTLLLLSLTREWLGERKTNFWTVILWVPYFVLYIYIFATAFPVTQSGDTPNPVTGLFIIAGLVIYPFYIMVLNSFSTAKDIRRLKV